MKRAILCILVLLSGCNRRPDIVYMNESRDWKLLSTNLCEISPLARELVRQAILLAARDELGLATRDARLGDAMPTQGDNAPLEVVAQINKPSFVEIVTGFSPNRTKLARHELGEAVERACWVDYCKLTELEETSSRTELLKDLKKAGFGGRSNRRDESIAVPKQLERLLGEMNFISQFHAVRELHELMRTQGESSALLGALARGYANLGVLTEFCWHPAHKVFKARALLYAQRMLARDVKSPVARWHRSYAAAMAGIHAWALSDLEEADKALQALREKDRPPMPAWAQLIGPLCRYEVEELGKHVKDEDIGQLAAMLKFLAVDQAGNWTWPVQTALEVLPTIPECYRVYDTLCTQAGVSVLHPATLAPIRIMGETIYGRLESIPNLPEKLRPIIAARKAESSPPSSLEDQSDPSSLGSEFVHRRNLMDALRDTGELTATNEKDKDKAPTLNLGEPSWVALGTLIRETSFLQVCQRAQFERHSWGVPTEEWLKKSSPLVAGHPLKPFLDIYAWSGKESSNARSRLVNLDVSGCNLTNHVLYYAFAGLKGAHHIDYFWRNQDCVVRDMFTAIRVQCNSGNAKIENVKRTGGMLLEISPHSPLARAILLQYDWEGNQSRVAQWEKDAAPYPGLLITLAERYTATGRYADAERALKAALKILPGDVGYWRRLADVYKIQGKMDRWLATLEEYLTKPDYNLDHYMVQTDIADYFMDRKEWKKALPHAKDAAECYSCFGLKCAARCYEGLQRWDEAEKYYRAASERYEGNSLSWYFFCCRTGQGDIKAAREWAQAYLDKGDERADSPGQFYWATFYLLENQPEKALAAAEQAALNKPAPYDVLWNVVVADLVKDAKKRDAALQRVKALGTELNKKMQDGKAKPDGKSPPADDGATILADLIINDLKQGGKGQIDLDATDKLIASVDPWFQAWFYYLLGQYLDTHGQHKNADRCWKQCISYPPAGNHRTLSGAMLLKHGIKPADYKSLLQPAEDKKKKKKV